MKKYLYAMVLGGAAMLFGFAGLSDAQAEPDSRLGNPEMGMMKDVRKPDPKLDARHHGARKHDGETRDADAAPQRPKPHAAAPAIKPFHDAQQGGAQPVDKRRQVHGPAGPDKVRHDGDNHRNAGKLSDGKMPKVRRDADNHHRSAPKMSGGGQISREPVRRHGAVRHDPAPNPDPRCLDVCKRGPEGGARDACIKKCESSRH